jgi:zinc protease
MRRLWIALLLLSSPAPRLAAQTPVTSTPLRNGLILILAPRAGAPRVALHATFDAGSGRDPAGRAGTAWLANRLLAERLPGVEADLTQDRAILAAEIDVGDLPSDFERLRGALLAERRQELAKPYSAAGPLLSKLAYGPRGYGHPPHAAPESVRRSDVDRFLARHYAPASAVVALAGSFDEARVRPLAAETLGRVAPDRSRPRCPPAAASLQAERRLTVRDPHAEAPQVSLAYPTTVSSDPDCSR